MAAQVSAGGQASPAGVRLLQAQRLQRLLGHAARRSPLYASMLAGRPPDARSLGALPVMRKRDLMDRFDDWVSKSRRVIGASTPCSGQSVH